MECACRIQKLKQVLALPVPSDGKDPKKAKEEKTKICRLAERKKAMESICFILFILRVGKLRSQKGDGTSSMARVELGAEPAWPSRMPACPPGLFPLCYMVFWGREGVERRHRKDEKCKKEKKEK